MWQGFLGLLYIFVLFSAILFLAYVSTKLIGSKTTKGMKGKYLKIVDSIILGLDRQIFLIKVGEQLLLVSSSNKNIRFLTVLDKDMIKLTEEDLKRIDQEQLQTKINNNFKNYFEAFKTNLNEKDSAISKSNQNKVNQNLNKLKSIFSKINTEKNGDEN